MSRSSETFSTLFLAHDRLGQQRVARAASQLVHRFLVEALDLEHLVQRHVGDFLERREAFLDEDVGDFLVDVEPVHEERADLLALGLLLLLRFLDAHQVDLPAGQLGGEPHVLSAAADRHGEILLVDDDVHRVLLLVDEDAGDLGRRERVDDELGRIVGVQDDVDALACELVGHRGHARAAHADAGSLRIEARIVRLHRDLGPDPGIARRGPDLDQSLLDFRHLQLEQPHQQLRHDARQDELRPARLRLDRRDVGAHSIAHAQVLLRDELVAREHAFDPARLDDHVAALDALDRTGEQVVLPLEKVVQDLLALGVADLLQDHLLRGLRADAAELHRLERLLDHVAELQRGVAIRGVGDRDLVRGLLVLLVRHDGPAPERFVVAGLAVDRYPGVDVVGVLLLGCRGERGFERREDDILGHVLLARERVDEQAAVRGSFRVSPFDPRHQARLVDVGERYRLNAFGCLELQHAGVDAAQHAFQTRARCRSARAA